jgi:hypothetical protein
MFFVCLMVGMDLLRMIKLNTYPTCDIPVSRGEVWVCYVRIMIIFHM